MWTMMTTVFSGAWLGVMFIIWTTNPDVWPDPWDGVVAGSVFGAVFGGLVAFIKYMGFR